MLYEVITVHVDLAAIRSGGRRHGCRELLPGEVEAGRIRCAELIPLCHPLALSGIDVDRNNFV